MNLDTKNKVLRWAEVIDSLRIFPRLFLLACFWWSVDTSYALLDWYMRLPDTARGLEASGFGVFALTGILTFMKLVYTTYSEAGRAWGPSAASSSVVTELKQSTTTDLPGGKQ